ncbi:hypothetical protein [Flavobacterium album]|nr:hypothetical protein [Flavobacterium album]
MENRDNLFLIPYSPAHIGDLTHGYSKKDRHEHINSDLKYISELSENLLLAKYSNQEIYFSKTNPEIIFDYISEQESKLSKLHYELKNVEIYKDLIFPIPINGIDNRLYDYITSDGYLTMENILMKTMEYIISLISTEEYKYLRNDFQESIGVNKDKIFNSPNPLYEIDKILKDKGISFSQLITESLTAIKEKSESNFIDEIITYYVGLDLIGYNQDEIKVSQKKSKTFHNTIDDANHVGYASVCDIFIVDDKRCKEKALYVYSELNINTKVFSSSEFVEYWNKVLTLDSLNNQLFKITSIANNFEPNIQEYFENYNLQGYLSQLYFFGYFNYISWFENIKNYHILRKVKPTNGNILLYDEFKHLTFHLIKYFGNDIHNKSVVTEDENFLKNLDEDDFILYRTWKVSNIGEIRLVVQKNHLSLYIDFRNTL